MKLKTQWKKTLSNWAEDFARESVLEEVMKSPSQEVWQWGEDQGFQTEGNRFRISMTPYLRQPLQDWRNPNIKTIVLAAPVQSAKTTAAELCMSYSISEESGNILFYAATDEDVKEFAETRMEAHYERLPRLRKMLHPDSSKTKKLLRIHRDRSWLSMLSAYNRKRLQSRTAKRVVGDEPSQWPEGHIEEARKRTTRFDRTSSKQMFISTPELMYLPVRRGDEHAPSSFYSIFIEGTQSEWGITCPRCKEWTSLALSNFIWTDEESGEEPRDDQGKWDFVSVKSNLRWKCSNESCNHCMKDTPKTRAWFTENGSYLAMNQAAMIEGERITASYHWTAFAVPWISWYSIVETFLKAQEMARRGNFLPLKEAVRKKLGEFWKENDHQTREMVITGGYSGEMDKNKRIWTAEPWEDVFVSPKKITLRFLTVDVQKDLFWVLVREWREDSGSRLRCVGSVDTWQEIEDLAASLSIPPVCVFVDSGWKRYGGSARENEVYRECYRRRWWALKGMDKDSWPWVIKGRGKFQRPMSPPDYRDGGQGTKSQGRSGARKFFMMFSNPTLKDHLHLLKTAAADTYFGIGANVPDWYVDQMEGEVKSQDTGRWEKIGENHLWDCYDAETEVLTEMNGFVKFTDLDRSERLATVNLETDIIEYHLPQHYIEKPYQGKMIRIGGGRRQSLDMLVTPNHRMVVKDGQRAKGWTIKQAKDITIWDKIKIRSNWSGKDQRHKYPFDVDPILFAKFLGWYIAEGCVSMRVQQRAKKETYTIQVYQSKTSPWIEDLRGTINKLPWKFRYALRQFVCHDRKLGQYLKKLGNCYTKRVPQWIKDSPPEVISSFIDGIIAGDGWNDGKHQAHATVSRLLADDMNELYLKAGYGVSLNVREGKEWKIRGESGQGSKQYHSHRKISESASLRDYKNTPNFRQIDYSGMVYCATVPTGTLIIRRNGKVAICGNCEMMQLVPAYLYGLFGGDE